MTTKQIVKITAAALADVNDIRKVVGLKPLKKFPNGTDDCDELERCFPAEGRDCGVVYIEFDLPRGKRFPGGGRFSCASTSAITAFEDYLYELEG